MSKGMLLDMGIMNPGQGQTLVQRVKVQSDHMEDALTFMREGRAYVRVAHEHGELRGQLVVPHCLDGDLNGTDQHYGFANIMVSPDPEDKSTAILVQVAFAVSYPRCRFFRMLPVFSALVALAPNLAHRFASVCVCVCVCVYTHTHAHVYTHEYTHRFASALDASMSAHSTAPCLVRSAACERRECPCHDDASFLIPPSRPMCDVWGESVCMYVIICMYVCMYVYIYVCTYMYVCLYVCI